MALRINHVRFLLIVAPLVLMVVTSVAGESFPVDSSVKQDSAKGNTIREEVFHDDYGSWSPTPKVPRGSPAPIPHDFTRPRRLKV
ncbi:hypothetical protein EUTSA_v10015749mg [Eutrema salsugineum]|uniref:Uncharacterized protein n=1 Tax=Eutrema salsugineum TaxID=72664 RepID=V4KQW0_EUTSA|nr:uncharacterized protein LOC18016795 [Eutrema salsugineum]ESQ40315.1 hypothetical protein EUTSA_v10015749mg [Eutrema salsugineum]